MLRRYAIVILMMLIAQYSAWAKPKPIDWDKALEKGRYELSIGNVDKAIGMFQEKVNKHPESGACHTALGLALKKKGRLGEAKSEFRRSTEAQPDYPDGYYELGAMLESDKEYNGAAQSFEKYLQLKPDCNNRATVADRIKFCREHM
jgi:tetratricopeptide (TPR) repeat protein